MSKTLKKEFGEEALNSLEASEQEKAEIERHINELFQAGDKVCLLTSTVCMVNVYTFQPLRLYSFHRHSKSEWHSPCIYVHTVRQMHAYVHVHV